MPGRAVDRLLCSALGVIAAISVSVNGAGSAMLSSGGRRTSVTVEGGEVVSDQALTALLRANLAQGQATVEAVGDLLFSSGIIATFQECGTESDRVVRAEADPSLQAIRRWLMLPPKSAVHLAEIRSAFGPRAAAVWANTVPEPVRSTKEWRAYQALSALVWPDNELMVVAVDHETHAWVRLSVFNGLATGPQYSLRHSKAGSITSNARAALHGTTVGNDALDVIKIAEKAVQMGPRDGASFLWHKYQTGCRNTWVLELTEAFALRAQDEELWIKAALAEKGVDALAGQELASAVPRSRLVALAGGIIDEALARSPDDALLWLAKGDMATAKWVLHCNGLDAAKAAYARASQLAPEWYLPRARLAEIQARDGDWESSQRSFCKALAVSAGESARRRLAHRFVFAAVVAGPVGAAEEIADDLIGRDILPRAAAEHALAAGFEARGAYKDADAHWEAGNASSDLPVSTR